MTILTPSPLRPFFLSFSFSRSPGRVQSVLEGSEVSLGCTVISSGSQSVEWMLPDLSILEESNSRLVSEGGRLVIGNASVSDSGLYHCLVRTETDVDMVPVRLTVKERLLSPNTLNGKKMEVESGESLSLPCYVNSAQPSETRWYLPKNQILQPSQPKGRVYVNQNGSLVIKKTTHEDAGEYSCLAANLYGVDMLAHLVVVTGEKDSDAKEEVEKESPGVETAISLDCVASGKPQAQISWILPDRTFVRDVGALDRSASLLANGTLRIQSANFSSKGDYRCIASNAAGADTVTFHIHVAALPPTINEEASESIVIQEGRSVFNQTQLFFSNTISVIQNNL
uniref:Ig-like domain-containing protein n=1 Tax=Oncorhynchus mykiss TaxID=8022 RepID=A0A8C7UM79_ONCMY